MSDETNEGTTGREPTNIPRGRNRGLQRFNTPITAPLDSRGAEIGGMQQGWRLG